MDNISSKRTLRKRAYSFAESTHFQRFILLIIGCNTAVLGFETSKELMASFGPFLVAIDRISLTIFLLEVCLKLFAYRTAYFRDPWNIFDFTIVSIALFPANEAFSVLRALRILRAFRFISMVPKMRMVVQAFLHAIPGMGSIMLLMSLVFYVFAVMATNFFGDAFDAWFGSVGSSLYSLFQIMTLESWSMGIVRPVMTQFPLAWAFFIPFILVTTFAVLNLFVAIVVNSMQEVHENENTADRDIPKLLGEIRSLKREIELLRRNLGD